MSTHLPLPIPIIAADPFAGIGLVNHLMRRLRIYTWADFIMRIDRFELTSMSLLNDLPTLLIFI